MAQFLLKRLLRQRIIAVHQPRFPLFASRFFAIVGSQTSFALC